MRAFSFLIALAVLAWPACVRAEGPVLKTDNPFIDSSAQDYVETSAGFIARQLAEKTAAASASAKPAVKDSVKNTADFKQAVKTRAAVPPAAKPVVSEQSKPAAEQPKPSARVSGGDGIETALLGEMNSPALCSTVWRYGELTAKAEADPTADFKVRFVGEPGPLASIVPPIGYNAGECVLIAPPPFSKAWTGARAVSVSLKFAAGSDPQAALSAALKKLGALGFVWKKTSALRAVILADAGTVTAPAFLVSVEGKIPGRSISAALEHPFVVSVGQI